MPHSTVLDPAETAVLVVDMQEKLLPKILNAEALTRNAAFLLDATKLLDVHVLATEQYPKGLGPTVAEIAKRLPEKRAEKTGFSCARVEGLTDSLRKLDKFRVVLVGIETHVCVLNTALDLIAEDFWVYLPVDALGSRYAIDHDTALRRMESAGAVLTTAETTVFEWLKDAKHPRFKEASGLVQQRMKELA
ncbi:MAG: isochorismatase family protein [Gemmataceae bacterium]|nr:isochorismatase family protein [Gemmataceae bacterium]